MTNKLEGIRLEPPVRKMPVAVDVDQIEKWAVIRGNASTLEIHTQATAFDTPEEAEAHVQTLTGVGTYVILHQVLSKVATFKVTSSVVQIKEE